MENRFNLIDEPWLPIVDYGRVSLKQLFSDTRYRRLSGNPVQKIALFKLLQAIAQAACTPDDDGEWRALGQHGMVERCLSYLNRWHDRFYLYGERPFLQMPAISAAAVQRFGAVSPQIATGNTTLLNHSQKERSLDDADKALLLVALAGFALAGKKTDNRIVLTPGYTGKQNDKGKPSSGRAGPSVAHMGLLHSFFMGETLWQTIWFNLLTQQDLESYGVYPGGVGTAVWEQMPQGENDETAQRLKTSLQGRLLPLCRFCLLSDGGLHYSEGIHHPSYREHVVDPTVSVNNIKDPKVLWVNPDKKPWREITSLLGFLQTDNAAPFKTLQLSAVFPRIRKQDQILTLWSGGLKVSSNAGEQYTTGGDDYVESEMRVHASTLKEMGFDHLKLEIADLETLAKMLYGATCGYFKDLKTDGPPLAAQATQMFWQLCERNLQPLIDAAFDNLEALPSLRKRFASYARTTYDRFCPRETARQIEVWSKHRLNTAKYLDARS